MRGLNKASVFFLEALSKHPSEDLTHLTETLIPVIESQPRLQNFSTERDFAQSTRRWKDKVKALRIDMERVPEGARWDDFENWWERLSDIVGILEGRPEVLKRVCDELGGDWKEVCVAWGIFVDPRLRRQDLVCVSLGPLGTTRLMTETGTSSLILCLTCHLTPQTSKIISMLRFWVEI